MRVSRANATPPLQSATKTLEDVNIHSIPLRMWIKKRGISEGSKEEEGGGMTQARQTGRRAEEGGKWREKEGKREQERAPLPSLNLSCSDQ